MSYEGYDVYICENGHYAVFDAYDDITLHETKCHTCGAKYVDVGHVDETNCLPYYLDFELHQFTPNVYEKCPTCGKLELIEEGRWEMRKVETYESEDGEWVKSVMDDVILDYKGE